MSFAAGAVEGINGFFHLRMLRQRTVLPHGDRGAERGGRERELAAMLGELTVVGAAAPVSGEDVSGDHRGQY